MMKLNQATDCFSGMLLWQVSQIVPKAMTPQLLIASHRRIVFDETHVHLCNARASSLPPAALQDDRISQRVYTRLSLLLASECLISQSSYSCKKDCIFHPCRFATRRSLFIRLCSYRKQRKEPQRWRRQCGRRSPRRCGSSSSRSRPSTR